MPPLPADAQAAWAAGADAALAFAIESARRALERGMPADGTRDLFTAALERLVRQALAPPGDPAFQAQVLRAQDAEVDLHAQLAALAAADRRALRSATDAVAHPGKLRNMPAGRLRTALLELHRLAEAGDWTGLQQCVGPLRAQDLQGHAPLAAALQALAAHSALQRLVRGSALQQQPQVQRYQALCAQRGPAAGSGAAAAQGRSSARLGSAAEERVVEMLREVAARLGALGAQHKVVRNLRPASGLPRAPARAKDEWDAALLAAPGDGSAALALLVEVKASPAAASDDYPRLLRGLAHLTALAAHETVHFASADGDLRVAGASLRALQPQGTTLPPHVVYACTAPADSRVPVLGAASKAMLLAEPASIAFGLRVASGEAPPPQALAPVWDALLGAPRLQGVLHQFHTAQQARAAMLHPRDLLEALELAGARA